MSKEREELESAPMWKLRQMCGDRDIKFKPSNKKAELVDYLIKGHGEVKAKLKPAPRLEDQKKEKSFAGIPDAVQAVLDNYQKQYGLVYKVDEKNNGLDLKTVRSDTGQVWMHIYTTLDASESAIINSIERCIGGQPNEAKSNMA